MLLSGCATNKVHTQASTGYQLIFPAGAETYDESERQVFLLGDRIGTAVLPTYPSDFLSKNLPEQYVCLEIDIDIHGQVFDSRPLYDGNGCPAESRRPDEAFLVAAKQAVQQWRFFPTRICTFPATAQKNEACQGENIEIEPVPVRLAFLFSFTMSHGAPKVESLPM
jgi:hypothetical protein